MLVVSPRNDRLFIKVWLLYGCAAPRHDLARGEDCRVDDGVRGLFEGCFGVEVVPSYLVFEFLVVEVFEVVSFAFSSVEVFDAGLVVDAG